MRLQKAPLVTSGLVLGLLGLGNLLKDLSLTLMLFAESLLS